MAGMCRAGRELRTVRIVDPEKAQRDTVVLFPALKFLWEVYRAVLDILKSNLKLERLHHGAAVAALRFCAE